MGVHRGPTLLGHPSTQSVYAPDTNLKAYYTYVAKISFPAKISELEQNLEQVIQHAVDIHVDSTLIGCSSTQIGYEYSSS